MLLVVKHHRKNILPPILNSARTYGEIRSSQVTTQVPQTERRTQSTIRNEYQTTRTPAATTGHVSENTTAHTVQRSVAQLTNNKRSHPEFAMILDDFFY